MRLAALSLVVLWSMGCPREKGGPTFEPSAVAARPVRLQFLPPDGRLLHERAVTERTEPSGAERVEATITARYDKQREGWLLTQWVPQVKVIRNGAEVPPQPLMDLVAKFPIKVQLAEDGAFIQLKNPEDAEAAVRTTFESPEQQRAALAYFTPEAIEKQARREWEEKYGGLLHRDLQPGAAFYSVEAFTTSDGAQVRYVLERKLTGVSPSARGDALSLTLRCLGRPEEVAALPDAQRALEGSGDLGLEASVSCDGQQLLSLSPFLPVKRWMRLSATPKTPEGTAIDVSLSREVTLLKLEEAR